MSCQWANTMTSLSTRVLQDFSTSSNQTVSARIKTASLLYCIVLNLIAIVMSPIEVVMNKFFLVSLRPSSVCPMPRGTIHIYSHWTSWNCDTWWSSCTQFLPMSSLAQLKILFLSSPGWSEFIQAIQNSTSEYVHFIAMVSFVPLEMLF